MVNTRRSFEPLRAVAGAPAKTAGRRLGGALIGAEMGGLPGHQSGPRPTHAAGQLANPGAGARRSPRGRRRPSLARRGAAEVQLEPAEPAQRKRDHRRDWAFPITASSRRTVATPGVVFGTADPPRRGRRRCDLIGGRTARRTTRRKPDMTDPYDPPRPRRRSADRGNDAVLVDLAVDRRPGHPQRLRRFDLITLVVQQVLDNGVALHRLQRAEQPAAHRPALWR
jgi:hypothetical protein